MSVYRIYVEKKPEFAVEADSLLGGIKSALGLENLKGMRVINRYDAEGLPVKDFELAIPVVFSEPAVDVTYDHLPAVGEDEQIFAVEYLPGQFDQRADSCAQCISLLTAGKRPVIKSARIYIVSGSLSDEELAQIKHYIINPVESREASLDEFETLDIKYDIPTEVSTVEGFIDSSEDDLKAMLSDLGLAMDLDDIKFCRKYFKEQEKRDPTITEIRMIDTYWSDHCRHTTFSTIVDNVSIEPDYIAATFTDYINARKDLYAGRTDKPITLMDLACFGAKQLKKAGLLKDLDESEEINACSVKIKVDVDGVDEDWLLMFKNETHNHPTEIEPFGGAATCLGGAIRDPLSGRSYVYQAMRVTGAGNPLVPVEDTIAGKLPQRKLVVGAANGYSSYGNQIGLATGHVNEIYHPGYVAKRMEIGAVIGAAPASNVRRERPAPEDIVILLGGKTGRDGCGGATGSSKSHTLHSLETCGAEVQKGNAPEERKLQRLFRNPEVTAMIKRCNDFGAGGVSVAIGELADGLQINLDLVTKKYDGLDGTELAISESQERMAVVIAKEDLEKFMAEAAKENLEATMVARVTEEPRLRMNWNGKTIVDLSREFLNSNGAEKHTDIEVPTPVFANDDGGADTADRWEAMISNLNICSQKGLVERFDSTIGAGTVLMPYGGKYQNTPTQAMACKLPVLNGETTTASVMGWGFNPFLSSVSPYHGAMSAVVESISKVIATGGSYKHCWLTFQEYFERTQNDPSRWGQPFSALLGAYKAQIELGCGSIGGKDSMSGTFENIDVPPTLVSFAVSTAKTDKVISQEFKKAGSKVILIKPEYDANNLVNFDSLKKVFEKVEKLIADGKVLSCWSVAYGGVSEAVAKMAFGNKIGFKFIGKVTPAELFRACYGSFVIELADGVDADERIIGITTNDYIIENNDYTVDLNKLQALWEGKLEPVYPVHVSEPAEKPNKYTFKAEERKAPAIKVAKPKVLIPVFPGTNCEYDTARQFEKAGAEAEIFVVRNLSEQAIKESVDAMEKKIKQSQIVMLPGGFSGGDEPDGSGKFIVSFLRNPKLTDAIHDLLKNRDGLMLGICNGFQALVKLGLVPYGEIVDMRDDSPTLTFNTIARHQSKMVNTRIASNKSPWLAACEVDDIHSIAISHGEGRFVATAEEIAKLAANGQIATQYVDFDGEPTFDIHCNPNTSFDAIEGITSPDGRVLGKMGHSERMGNGVCINVPGAKDQKIFESGVKYFK
ncbi:MULTISPECIES: phosphoribosylformylglycinamidine synthase [Ruminococcus]|uniref:Phosphoribosylformylglycinamidine synthase n=1 Tax=Ruminococcus albus (strain ATCC 27210 / DSM 20455 / JCM 14654 / NCDO 2250 / 7) TaxID=697329 RepID=E6UIX1_RUMA7|nr:MULTISPECIES: phosphoribosylformylglycinamidine synthase [Ruminococcus]ADU22237.1 phosphoribosylformylglycinamidine synthase [Ruminococcus albus 7 = DSM 20455]MCR5020444.1 phosphoribosylformylglycinamidine synthase [Ruminococcus sp.]